MRCCGCLLLLLLVGALMFIIGLLAGRPDDGVEDEERAAIVTFLMD